uniref:LIM domain only protein 7b isoform X1 n=1 Tax=Centroberyx gerrardi TaxID=166262 RepID=UPI003AADDB41
MEWRQQTSISYVDAFNEAQRWMEEVTGKSFGSNDFRAALENGVLLCDLINQLKPGIIKRVNRLSTPIAGLDNVNVFLKACGKLGLNEAQLFHPGDLQDLSTRVTLRREESNRRLKNVLITIYWLGRKAQLDPFYSGPQLNFKAFEGLLGLALSKALDDGSGVCVKESGYRECCYPEREDLRRMRAGYRRGDSVDSIDSLDSRPLRTCSECCESDAEAEQGFRMEATQPSARQSKGYVPPMLRRRKQGRDEIGRGCLSPLTRACQIQVRPGRPPQVNPGWIWSKSLSDIPMVYPVYKVYERNTFDAGQDIGRARQWRQGHPQKSSTSPKDGEAKWHDDLTKWKSRRRSTNSDLRRKLQDREHVINQMTNGAVTNFGENGAQGGLSKRDQQSPSSHNPAPSSSSTTAASKAPSSDLRPHTRALLARSYATEAPFSPTAPYTQGSIGAMPASDPTSLGEEIYSASLASDGAGVTTPSLDYPFSSQTQVKAQGSQAPLQPISELGQPGNVITHHISSPVTTALPSEADGSVAAVINGPMSAMVTDLTHKELSFCMDPKVPTVHPGAGNQPTVYALKDLSHQSHKSEEEAQQTSRRQAVQHGTDQQAQSFQRYMTRTGSWSGSASLPRGYRRSEGSSRLSAAITARPFGTKPSRVSSLPRLCNVNDNNGLLLNSETDGSLQPARPTLIRQVATSQIRGQHQASVRQDSGNQEAKQNGEEQREEGKCASSFSLTCQTNGYHYQPHTQTQLLPQPYSSLQSQHSKSQSVPSNLVIAPPKVQHSDMRVSLSLKPNSRPDFGFQTHWDSTGARVKSVQLGSPAELCQLCVDDEIVAVDGIAVTHMSYDQWKNTMTSALQNGSLTMDVRRYGNKDWSSSGGSHHNLPCQSRKTLNLTAAAPMLIGCPDHHANNAVSAEITAMMPSKFNGQAVNGLDCKGMNGDFADNSRISRSKGGSESAISDLQVPSLSPSSSSWSWDHEDERRRQEKWQEEQERLLQEQYQRDQERLEAEWRRAQQDAMGEEHRKPEQTTYEITNGVVRPASTQLPVNGMTNKSKENERSTHREELKQAGSAPQRSEQGVQNDKITKQDWAKSKSTPALAGLHKQTRGDQRKRKGQCVSKVERERQQILEEMKKRTPLLTDNSWIRQRSASMYKEPVYIGVPLKRCESLDNLQSPLRQSPGLTTAASYARPQSAAAGYSLPSRSSSPRYSMGAGLSQTQASWSMDSSSHFIPGDESTGQSLPGSQQLGRLVSGRRTCCVCERVLGRGAAMVIEALGLCFHLACFQCVDCCRRLGGTGTGVQVRIRNRKPYCEPCYFQLKSISAPSM